MNQRDKDIAVGETRYNETDGSAYIFADGADYARKEFLQRVRALRNSLFDSELEALIAELEAP